MSDEAQERVGGEDKVHLEVEGQIPVKVDFTGGLELLFSNQRSHRISLPSGVPVAAPDNLGESSTDECMQTRPTDINYLLHYLRDNLLQERVELFMQNDTIRPGILVLVNDSDWELEGEGDYQLKPNDEIVFISTLHGG